MKSHSVFFPALAVAALLSPSAWAQLPPVGTEDQQYKALTQDYEEWTNFNVETAHSMELTSDNVLYAINTHGSALVEFTNVSQSNYWSTVHNPVAMALVDDMGTQVAVLGGSTHALVIHDTSTGAIVSSLSLPSEPGDLVIDRENAEAFVSCMGANQVLQIDLVTMTVVRTFDIPSEAPRFLALELEGNDLVLYVAPFLSGNNTIPFSPPNNPGVAKADALGRILDLYNQTQVCVPTPMMNVQLPDEDLFRIDVQAAAPVVSPVLRRAGTLLTAHGRNPATGDYWMLGMNALNADPSRTDEPALNGNFVRNQLAIAPTLGGSPLPQPTIQDLDDDDPMTAGEQYNASSSMSFPWGLDFHSSGFALVTSSTSSRLSLLMSNGGHVAHRDLPSGSIPRQVLIDASETFVFVYCWGTNKIQVLLWSDLLGMPFELDLGLDPTPERVRDGRVIFYDALASKNGQSTCASCHPGGGMDGVAWPIADKPRDYKDIMVTQSLKSIEDTFPYHWRGERNLDDFNGAHRGLLGKMQNLNANPDKDLDRFNAFVFSLQSAANPAQDLSRTIQSNVSNGLAYPNGKVGNAVTGQMVFDSKDGFLGQSCSDCHSFPLGSIGDPVFDSDTFVARQTNMDVAHLRQLTHKTQPEIVVNPDGCPTSSQIVSRTGFGLAHLGAFANIFRFVSAGAFGLNAQEAADVSEFVKQYDYGIAPAAHTAYFVDAGSLAVLDNQVTQLVPQVNLGWIDLVAIGRVPAGGGLIDVRFLYDPVAATFTPNVSSGAVGTPTLAGLRNWAATANATLLFLGLPPGNGQRFALDPDNDCLTDEYELTANPYVTDPNDWDTDNDTHDDGWEALNTGNPVQSGPPPNDTTAPQLLNHKLEMTTASVAKYSVEFSEPVNWTVTYQTANGPVHVSNKYEYVKKANIVLQDLEPSSVFGLSVFNQYTPSIIFKDRKGLPGIRNLTTAQSDEMVIPPNLPLSTHVGALSFTSVVKDTVAGTMKLKANVGLMRKGLTPTYLFGAPGLHVVAQVLVHDPVTDKWSIAANVTSTTNSVHTGFDIMPVGSPPPPDVPYVALPGPFVISTVTIVNSPPPSMAYGDFTEFTVGGLTPGQTVRLNVLDVLKLDRPKAPNWTVRPWVFDAASRGTWQFPTNPKATRGIDQLF